MFGGMIRGRSRKTIRTRPLLTVKKLPFNFIDIFLVELKPKLGKRNRMVSCNLLP